MLEVGPGLVPAVATAAAPARQAVGRSTTSMFSAIGLQILSVG